MIQIQDTDKLFKDSPDAGSDDCLCSRCSNKINEGEVPVRIWTTNEHDEVDENSMEYRYCENCQTKSGMTIIKGGGHDCEEHY